MITKRSSHIPTRMPTPATSRTGALRRARRNQKSCGVNTFSAIISQYNVAMGPRMRCTKYSRNSNGSAEYHAVNSSTR